MESNRVLSGNLNLSFRDFKVTRNLDSDKK